ncbi:MAG: hypothetical protein JEZ12_22940 [Desulfobacterium sp.]|nr:hypothetical protein [Desulfobacterium sp.]
MNISDKTEQNSTAWINLALGSLSDSIVNSMTDTESQFLQLGQSLQDIYSNSDGLIEKITSAAERFNITSEQNIIQAIERSIHDVLAELTGYPDKISSRLGHISESGQHLEELCNLSIRFKNASRFLNVVGFNFDIEGCRSREAMDLFDGFAAEIKALSVKINEITEKMFVDSTKALAGQKSGLSGTSEKIKEIQDLTCEAQDSVIKTMENIQSLADMSCKTLEQAQHTAQAIQKRVGEIVMAIQFHDIARQQLEHVNQAFEDVAQWLKEKKASDAEIQTTVALKIPDQIISILKVQCEQLAHVTKEINQAYEKIMSSFHEINSEVSNLKHLLSESDPSENTSLSLETEFESIALRMENLKQLQVQGRNLGNDMAITIQESSDVVSTLSQYADQIDNINTGLKHKALNAIIMTTKLGEKGFTLEVLAREVRNISVECTGLVEAALKNLDSISGMATLLNSDDDEKSIQSFEGIPLDVSINQISDLLDAQKKDSDHVVHIAHDLEEKIEHTGKGLSFLNVWIEQLTKDGAALNELISTLKPFVNMDTQDDSGRIEALSKRYTMESERIIHGRISGELPESLSSDDCLEPATEQGVPDPESKEKDDGDGDDEFDDNIELF